MLRPPTRALPSVIVDTEKVLREAGGPVEMSALPLPSGGKVFAPRCESRSGEPVRSPKNISGTQRHCELSKDIVDNYRTMFESRISAERTEKLPFP